jgi:hypothetical protein
MSALSFGSSVIFLSWLIMIFQIGAIEELQLKVGGDIADFQGKWWWS